MRTETITPADVTGIDEFADDLDRAEDHAYRAVGEPLVYTRDSPRSYFMDWRDATQGDSHAGEMLERHSRQMADIVHERRAGARFEQRVNPNLETGHGGEFAPPEWLNEYFATARRAGRILQRLVHEWDLPQGASSINLPRITQGTLVNDQTPGGATDSEDVETAGVKAQVLDYSGNSDWSMQAFEQSPRGAHLDWVVFTDMTESLDAELEADLITGKGEALNEALGLFNVEGINKVTYTSATPNGAELMKFFGEAAAQSGAKRKRPPTAWLMTTGRFFWVAFSADNSNRPLSIEDYPQSDFPNAGLGSIGVYFDDAISQSVNGKEQDLIIACRPDDFHLWHSPVKTMVREDVLSGTLQVRFSLWRSTASMLNRYPSGISVITGTGLKVQKGFS